MFDRLLDVAFEFFKLFGCSVEFQLPTRYFLFETFHLTYVLFLLLLSFLKLFLQLVYIIFGHILFLAYYVSYLLAFCFICLECFVFILQLLKWWLKFNKALVLKLDIVLEGFYEIL